MMVGVVFFFSHCISEQNRTDAFLSSPSLQRQVEDRRSGQIHAALQNILPKSIVKDGWEKCRSFADQTKIAHVWVWAGLCIDTRILSVPQPIRILKSIL